MNDGKVEGVIYDAPALEAATRSKCDLQTAPDEVFDQFLLAWGVNPNVIPAELQGRLNEALLRK